MGRAEQQTIATGHDIGGARTVLAGVLLALLTLAYVLLLGWRFRNLMMDDAYIGLVYVRNLLDGHGFVFFPGAKPVEGVSNIGWVAMLVPLATVLGPELAAKFLGAILLLLALALTWRVGRIVARALESIPVAEWIALAPPLLLAASFDFVYFPLVGMETSLLAVLLLGMALAGVARPESPWVALLGVMAFTVHPEAIIVYPIFVMLRSRSGERRLVVGLGLFALMVAAVTMARLAIFGDVLPNTALAKPGDPRVFAVNLIELVSGQHKGVPFPIDGLGLPILLLGWGLVRRGHAALADMLAASVLAGLAFALYARPDWTETGRYFAPYLPAALILFWTGAVDLAARLARRPLAVLVPLGFLVLLVNAIGMGREVGSLDRYPGYVMASNTLAAPARWMRDNLPPDAMIATRRVGTLAFYSERRVFDYAYGLADRQVARAVAAKGEPLFQPTDPALASIWWSGQPDYLLEDGPILDDIARRAGGDRQRFVIHGIAYSVTRTFRIAPDIEWTLAERID